MGRITLNSGGRLLIQTDGQTDRHAHTHTHTHTHTARERETHRARTREIDSVAAWMTHFVMYINIHRTVAHIYFNIKRITGDSSPAPDAQNLHLLNITHISIYTHTLQTDTGTHTPTQTHTPYRHTHTYNHPHTHIA